MVHDQHDHIEGAGGPLTARRYSIVFVYKIRLGLLCRASSGALHAQSVDYCVWMGRNAQPTQSDPMRSSHCIMSVWPRRGGNLLDDGQHPLLRAHSAPALVCALVLHSVVGAPQ